MSNRTEADVSYEAELKISHLQQIDILTNTKMSRSEQVHLFCRAARFDGFETTRVMQDVFCYPEFSVACLCWRYGSAEYSLFANLPGMCCPQIEVAEGRRQFEGIPHHIDKEWTPNAEMLQAFARVQQEFRVKA